MQKSFYEELNSSSHPVTNQEHEKMFFNKDNPFFNFLSDEEKNVCEGTMKKVECLNALKNMKNRKSPGLNSFTV